MLLLGRKDREEENDCLKRDGSWSQKLLFRFSWESLNSFHYYHGLTSPTEMKHIHPFSLPQSGMNSNKIKAWFLESGLG